MSASRAASPTGTRRSRDRARSRTRVAVGHRHQLARASADQRASNSTGISLASQSWMSCGVNWKCHLILPSVGLRAIERAGVEVVAGPWIAVPVRSGIARAPVHEVQRRDRTNRSATPSRRRSSSCLPPQVSVPRLARRGNRMRAPHALAGLRIVGVEEPADAGFRARHADDDPAVERQRRRASRSSRTCCRRPRCPSATAPDFASSAIRWPCDRYRRRPCRRGSRRRD